MPTFLTALITAIIAKVNLFDLGFLIASNLRVPWIKRLVLTDDEIASLETKLEHGDFLLGRRDWYLKNILVPGRYKHVATWDNERKLVLEMQDSGYEENSLRSFIPRYTEVAVYRPTVFTEQYAREFIDEMKTYKGKKYDKKYSKNTECMYCSESVYNADTLRLLKYDATPLFWFDVFIPDKLRELNTVKHVATVSRPNTVFLFFI